MNSLDKFLEFNIDKLTADKCIPIDLNAISAGVGAVVEEREMIPEAVMEVKNGQFHIYLQSNFHRLPGTAMRRRFSLAHEIGHTFFYERRDGKIRVRKGAPKGDKLEAACHTAASMILIPSKMLRSELRERELADTSSIVEFAARFEVSIEVMIRRLHEFGSFGSGWAPILTRRSGGTLEIEYAVYDSWLIPHIIPPKRGMAFTEWFHGTKQPNGNLKKRIRDGSLEAIPKDITSSLVIFEVRLQP